MLGSIFISVGQGGIPEKFATNVADDEIVLCADVSTLDAGICQARIGQLLRAWPGTRFIVRIFLNENPLSDSLLNCLLLLTWHPKYLNSELYGPTIFLNGHKESINSTKDRLAGLSLAQGRLGPRFFWVEEAYVLASRVAQLGLTSLLREILTNPGNRLLFEHGMVFVEPVQGQNYRDLPEVLERIYHTSLREDELTTALLVSRHHNIKRNNELLDQKRSLLHRRQFQSMRTLSDHQFAAPAQLRAISEFYRTEYEILPTWYKRFGHIIKVLMGKRSFRSLFNDNVKKYKD
ncbi:MAG: hypothetical protein ACK4E0_06310 [Chitinophagaceae bacterium]